jgi:hypothetical protein
VSSILDHVQAFRGRDPSSKPTYRASTGTTLMLLNGEPLISFVLTTV